MEEVKTILEKLNKIESKIDRIGEAEYQYDRWHNIVNTDPIDYPPDSNLDH